MMSPACVDNSGLPKVSLLTVVREVVEEQLRKITNCVLKTGLRMIGTVLFSHTRRI
jgi:hypothetical protein